MRAPELNNLLRIGAHQRVRHHLKKLSLKERLPLLLECFPYVRESPANLKFFSENFSQEIGAILEAGQDLLKAEQLYNSAKRT